MGSMTIAAVVLIALQLGTAGAQARALDAASSNEAAVEAGVPPEYQREWLAAAQEAQDAAAEATEAPPPEMSEAQFEAWATRQAACQEMPLAQLIDTATSIQQQNRRMKIATDMINGTTHNVPDLIANEAVSFLREVRAEQEKAASDIIRYAADLHIARQRLCGF